MARPYICRLIRFHRVTCPSTWPELHGSRSAGRMLAYSCWSPFAHDWNSAIPLAAHAANQSSSAVGVRCRTSVWNACANSWALHYWMVHTACAGSGIVIRKLDRRAEQQPYQMAWRRERTWFGLGHAVAAWRRTLHTNALFFWRGVCGFSPLMRHPAPHLASDTPIPVGLNRPPELAGIRAALRPASLEIGQRGIKDAGV